MKKILMTGFDPFGEETINPALEAVKKLGGFRSGEAEIIALEVPTIFRESIDKVIGAIEEIGPDVVILVGQAGGRTDITPERIAINVDDARIPDNAGNQPIDEKIEDGGPAAYWTTLPVKRIVSEMRKAGIPASVSNTAGTFVCNHLFYGIMHHLAIHAPHIRAGFIHIPYIPAQVLQSGAPSMSLDLIAEGLEIAAMTAAEDQEDIREIGGTTH